jgi:hypothetical protein
MKQLVSKYNNVVVGILIAFMVLSIIPLISPIRSNLFTGVGVSILMVYAFFLFVANEICVQNKFSHYYLNI